MSTGAAFASKAIARMTGCGRNESSAWIATWPTRQLSKPKPRAASVARACHALIACWVRPSSAFLRDAPLTENWVPSTTSPPSACNCVISADIDAKSLPSSFSVCATRQRAGWFFSAT